MKIVLHHTRVRLLLVILLALASHTSAAQWNEKVIYSFQGEPNDGFWPAGGVVFDKAGNLYGATTGGGPANCLPIASECGMVFELSPPAKKGDLWTETILYQFKGKGSNDGSVPSGGVILDGAGNLYGVTAYGGTGDCNIGVSAGCGTVYELSPPAKKGDPWTETILHSFTSGKDGYFPWGTLTFDAKGNLYGATQFGGGKGTSCDPFYQYCGTVFEMNPPRQKGGKWTEKVLHSFAGDKDGANPNGGLVLDQHGTVYGMTQTGGSQQCYAKGSSVGCGTVFELRPPLKKGSGWEERFLHVFTDGNDGGLPDFGLIFDGSGSGFYGATRGGGTGQYGVVFHLSNRDGHDETVLYNFTGAQDGRDPGLPTLDITGRLYGATFDGGSGFGGTVFRLEKTNTVRWRLATLHSFTGGRLDGAGPNSPVIFGMNSNIFGTTQAGGTGQNCDSSGCGTVFELSPEADSRSVR